MGRKSAGQGNGSGAQARLRKALRDVLEDARGVLEARQCLGDGEVVHQLRLAMKRLRALLRLLRPALTRKTYRRLDGRCRDFASSLAEARDLEVARNTLEQLLAGAPSPVTGQHLLMALQPQEGRESAPIRRPCWAALDATLVELQEACAALPLDKIDANQLRDALLESYRQSRKGWRAARESADSHRLHQWRKAVKRLLYQNLLLQGGGDSHLQQLKKLSDHLGDLHDLDVLEQRLREQRHRYWLEDQQLLSSRLQARREKLYLKSLDQGGRIHGKGDLKKRVNRLLA